MVQTAVVSFSGRQFAGQVTSANEATPEASTVSVPAGTVVAVLSWLICTVSDCDGAGEPSSDGPARVISYGSDQSHRASEAAAAGAAAGPVTAASAPSAAAEAMSVFFTGIKTAEIGGWLYGRDGPVSVRRVGRATVGNARVGDEVADLGAAAAAGGGGESSDVAAAGADLHNGMPPLFQLRISVFG